MSGTTPSDSLSRAKRIVSSVSVNVPIWFTLMRMAFAARSRIPWSSRSTFVTKRSSPTI